MRHFDKILQVFLRHTSKTASAASEVLKAGREFRIFADNTQLQAPLRVAEVLFYNSAKKTHLDIHRHPYQVLVCSDTVLCLLRLTALKTKEERDKLHHEVLEYIGYSNVVFLFLFFFSAELELLADREYETPCHQSHFFQLAPVS